jgi:RNA polymerase sigma factor (sigma-70 family)
MATAISRRLAKRYGRLLSDVYQDASLLIAQNQDGVPPPAVEFARWMYMKVWGNLEHRYRRAAKNQARDVRIEQYRVRAKTTANPTEQAEQAADVAGAIEKLSPLHRAIVHAFYYEGKTQSEIAAERGVTQPAVSEVLTRARSILRTHLSAYDPTEE